ncbi:hypothetical protein [Candidatus Mycoplasma haematohominis]|uniref:hypothetical protein n=1 Tax=Candidatus Mycoplasma haematohominis TaxID=1494318 RepID=UPI001C0A6A70|nr:hypothetical protein [Candidatus Mycoplasma haemohominis]
MFGLGAGYLVGGTCIGVACLAAFIGLFKYGIDKSKEDFNRQPEFTIKEDGELKKQFDELAVRAEDKLKNGTGKGEQVNVSTHSVTTRTTTEVRSNK